MAFGPTSQGQAAQIQLGDLLARHLAGANLLGRLHVAKVGLVKTGRPVRLAVGSNHVSHLFDEAGSSGDVLDIGFNFNLPAEGAIDYLRNLTPVTRHVFDGLTQQYRSDAFTIAGVSDQRLIGKIRDALAETVAHGGTAEDFHNAVDELTTEAGVEKLAAFELDTIFSSNTGKAYSSGRLEQLREPGMLEALPYWQYWTAGDMRVRPAHAALDGFCARAIDPVWLRIYPPNGYNCRCGVAPLLADEAPKGSDEGGIERLPVMANFARPPGWTPLRW